MLALCSFSELPFIPVASCSIEADHACVPHKNKNETKIHDVYLLQYAFKITFTSKTNHPSVIPYRKAY